MENLIGTLLAGFTDWLLEWKRLIGWAAFALFVFCVGAALLTVSPRPAVMLTAVGLIGMAAAASVLPAPGTPSKQNQFPFWQSGQQIIAGALGQNQFAVNINDHSFNGVSLLANSTGAFSTQISIGGRNFQSAAVHSGNMWGTGQLPFNLALPMTISKGTVITITFIDLSGNAGNTINWAIHGYQYD
jgi:hypothetical protein